MNRATEALDFLRQAGRVVCDASPESDADTLRRVMWLVESARVALAEEPAPAPAPLRSAEEIAREMVTVEYDKDTGAHYAVIWDRKADVEVCLEDTSTEAGARDVAMTAEGILRRVLEQGRAEGGAAALAAQQPRDLAGRIRALVQEYAGRWADAEDEQRAALFDALVSLRYARDEVLLGHGLAAVGKMRESTVEATRKAAAELEAIVREHEASR